VFMPSGTYCVVVSNGFFRSYSYTANVVMLTLHYGWLHASAVWTAVQFVFRQYVICCRGNQDKPLEKIVITGTVAWCLIGFGIHAALFLSNPNTEAGMQVLRDNNWPTRSSDGSVLMPFAFYL
ncbi:hypothetical protein AAVH_42802, partial [Aphelenchoides avenae]